MRTRIDNKENDKNLSFQKQEFPNVTNNFIDKRPEINENKVLQSLASNSVKTRQLKSLQTRSTENEEKGLAIQRKANKTGLPDRLKSGIENLSGYSMDDVKVHYNSDKPTQLNAHAYAQGTNIHLAPGQEKHLPHEAWHVVQQKQGRVKPTMQMKGKIAVNDNVDLEKEADVMGMKALQMKHSKKIEYTNVPSKVLSLEKAPILDHLTIQRNGKHAAEGSPEANQIYELMKPYIKDGVIPPKPDNPASIAAIREMMPLMPVDQIVAALKLHPLGTEAWESLFLNQELITGNEKAFRGAEIWGQTGRWTLIFPLGIGTEANVFYGQKSYGGGQAAIKIFKGNTPEFQNAFDQEIKAHEKIKELDALGVPIPNIVRMLDHNKFLRTVIMERVVGFSLDKIADNLGKQDLNALNDEVTEAKNKAIAKTSKALAEYGYALGDLQDRNIMYHKETKKITFVDISLVKINK